MDWQFSRRALRFQPNIFNVLKDLKGERLARGEWVCDLSVGTPDFPVAEHIRAAAAQRRSTRRITSTRWAICRSLRRRYSAGTRGATASRWRKMK